MGGQAGRWVSRMAGQPNGRSTDDYDSIASGEAVEQAETRP